MDSKGRSLPAMPEPKNPTSMKQLSGSPGGCTGRGDGSTDPTLLLDKAAAQVAATPQESVLQKMSNHNHTHGHNHAHERLKDLTSRLLNGDQDKIPKLCPASATPPFLKGVEPGSQHGSPQRKSESSPELTLKITKHLANGKSPPPSRYDSSYGEEVTEEPNSALSLSEDIMDSPESRKEGRKRKRGPVKKRVPPRHPIVAAAIDPERSSVMHTTIEPFDKATESPGLTPDADVLPTESHDVTDTDVPACVSPFFVVPTSTAEEDTCVQGVDEVKGGPTEDQPHLLFFVGDIVWTKVSGYPWWPCMITTDPEFNLHFRQKAVNSRTGLLYHIQYFSDAPERGYIAGKNMVKFSGKEQYQLLCHGSKQTSAHFAGKKLSIPRKLRTPWEMGISQATEALTLSVEERLAKFSFTYEGGHPQFNSHMMQVLQQQREQEQPQQGHGKFPETASLTPPDSTQSSPITVQTPSSPLLFICPTDSTSAGKMPLGTKAPAKRRRYNQHTSVRRRKKVVVPAVVFPHTDATVQDIPVDPYKQEPKNKTDSGKLSKESLLKQDIFFADFDPQLKAPQKKQGKLRQKFPAAPNSLKNKKIKASARIENAENLNIEPAKPVIIDGTVGKMRRKPKKDSADAGSRDKAALKRALEEAEEEEPHPKKRAKLAEGLKRHKNQKAQTTEPVASIKRRKKPSSAMEKRKGFRTPASGAEPHANAKRVRKRKKDSGNRSIGATSKKRRPSSQLELETLCDERPDSPSDSTDEAHTNKKAERAKKESVCQICEKTSEDLVMCEGQCYGSYHLQCVGLDQPTNKVLCTACRTGVHACFTCKQSEGEVKRCSVLHCGRFYHEACLRLNALTVFDNRGFRCPLHTCLSCHYSSRGTAKATKGKMIRCLRCPVAYHTGDLCVAAGSEMLTSTAIVCTNHFNPKKGYSHHSHVNVSWCFICSKGGSLLCCESCPAAFHPDCLNIAMPDGSWFCNDCRSGKKPKYRDIIWVKLGNYRWWPAEIRHPRNIPTNIQHLRHEIGEFPVYFFGSKDYFWTHQGRVFPYIEGDRGSRHQRNGIGKVFKNALLEAEARFKQIKMEREAKEAQENNKKPPPYKYIKINKPCGRVQIYTADISEIPKCNCKPTDERPCSFESECLNRMLLYECHPQVCPAGERCMNQDFTKRLYPETKIFRTAGKGWGLFTLRDIKKGEFVNEYVGELIDEEECRARIKYAQENDITNFYMLTIDKDRIIDAGPKGNYSRFMNHSCQPNCETQKWTVNGDTRVGLFAVCDIPTGTELTFNYNLDCLGNEKTVCRCGAPNCSGFLGDRPKIAPSSESKAKPPKKKPRKRRARNEGKKQSEDDCFRCGDGGELVLCDKKGCTKAYHLSCLDRTKRPFGRWDCPWHHCDVCGKPSDVFCQHCPNSFCKAHEEGALRPHPITGQLCCQEHEDSDLQASMENSKELSSTSQPLLPKKIAKRGRKAGTKNTSDRAANKGPKKSSKKAAEA
ncbi:histone-lysine N-methyltransferase NSD2 isoform X1 [Pygocentrus nattereri]|uniref:Nuclear receptor binding SET domain protein 2 n=1 Tax=Pygocentrus nattereri TaxID=42514 RepID=A0AAR2JNF2_PYGNA|nr:histone-lysine N-methyltransferase NSD2 isoform X1 [Pygocentrus nattereri]XP_037394186.1 histone-lysine N-methyltransferase NSD2 isoform X1 [Pygocentrus nattereri]XP_037394187.1 histone-lysine N-methyltransferase NSD2 isoform X1 [Pygocentrus nattereri]XP_037394188.1 histone-lysine N-methyltransferase NSD2 isoform X1 [Pygocentrus nattereri]XP_037394189.1 histone-lysine N-methyltransferase NSD2 isoform X1 [Pygocentrus nattereri]